MCGRYDLHASNEEVTKTFGLESCPELKPRYNISPGTDIPAIRLSPGGERVLHFLRWGLVPNWCKDPSIGSKLINARGETIAVKPSFREAFARRRCLVPANGYYEWKTEGTRKLPYYIQYKTEELMALGGLWESWKAPDGFVLRTVCLITTIPNQDVSFIHDRMPVLIPQAHWADWLSGIKVKALDLLKTPSEKILSFWRVDTRLNKTKENDASMIEPLSE